MKKHILAVLAAGSLWGFMGLFRRCLGDAGVSMPGVIFLRCAPAALLFAVTLLLRGPRLFRVRLRDAWCFAGAGLFSLFFFSFCYFRAMEHMSLAAAAILLYTAPAIVTLLSALLFGERLTRRKGLALLLAFGGCALVSGLGAGTGAGLGLTGLLYGLGSGLGYALYSIFARCALARGYHSNTINFYACLLAALAAALLWGAREPLAFMTASWGNAALCLATAAVTCYLPYLLYTYGLTGLETGRASILASVEPVVATLVGVLVFHEPLGLPALAGVALVLAAVALLNLPARGEGGRR